MPRIDIPEVGVVEFPDDMTDAQIEAAIQRDILPSAPSEKVYLDIGKPRGVAEPEVQSPTLAQNISAAARPVLEAGGAMFGGVAGAVLGAPSVIGAPIGAVAGSAFGYAAGEQIADILDEQLGIKAPDTLKQEVAELGTNLTWGALGELGLPAAVGAAKSLKSAIASKFPTMTKTGIEDIAGKILRNVSTIADPNQAERMALQRKDWERVGDTLGVKFTFGQRMDAPDIDTTKLKQLEAQLLNTPKGKMLSTEQRKMINQAIRSRLEGSFPKGNIDDSISHVQKYADALADNIDISKGTQSELLQKMSPRQDIQIHGKAITERVQKEYNAVKKISDAKFADVPNVKLLDEEVSSLHNELVDARSEFAKKGGEAIPHSLRDMLSKVSPLVEEKTVFGAYGEPIGEAVTKQPPISYKELQRLKTEIGNEIGNLNRKGLGAIGLNTEERLQKELLGNAYHKVDDFIVNRMGARDTKLGQAHREAVDYFREKIVRSYRKSSLGDLIKEDMTVAGVKKAPAAVGTMFFGKAPIYLTRADELKNALGSEGARDTIRETAQYSLLNTKDLKDSVTGQINSNKLRGWVQEHLPILKKYGLQDEYKNIYMLQRQIDEVETKLAEYNQTVAGVLLKKHPTEAVASALKGSPNVAKTAKELLTIMGGNKAGEAGIKKSFADFLRMEVESKAPGLAHEPVKAARAIETVIREYSPAISVMYQGDKKALQSMLLVRKTLQNLAHMDAVDASHIGDKATLVEVISEQLGRDMRGPAATTAIAGAGALAELVVPGPTGIPSAIGFLSAKIASKALNRYFEKMSTEQVSEILVKAAFDPDYAEILMMPHLRLTPQQFDQKMTRHLIKLGLLAVDSEGQPVEGSE